MTSAPTPQNLQTAGFTLLEMLVVMVILAVVGVVVLPQFTRPSDATRLEATAREIIGALRLTRAAAISRNTETNLVIDVDRRTFQSNVASLRHWPPDIQAHMKVAAPERPTASQGSFRFFPDGSTTGGDVTLSLNGKDAKLCVNWLTGRTSQGPGC